MSVTAIRKVCHGYCWNEANELRRPRHFHIIIALDPNGRLMMKRDMVLIRRILIQVESWKNQEPKVVDFNDEPDKNKIGHHVALLHRPDFWKSMAAYIDHQQLAN